MRSTSLARLFVAALALADLAAGAPAVHAAASVDYRGAALPQRLVETVARPALAAPGDSVALAQVLGAVVQRLEGLGYLGARAHGEWRDGGATLAITTTEGARRRLVSWVLHTPSAADSAALAAELRLVAGGWASPAVVREAVERGVREVADRGHPYAFLGVSDWSVDSSGLHLAFDGGLGPLVTVSDVRLEGMRVTQRRLAEKSMGRLVGVPYNRAAAEAARERLVQLGLFRSVAYEGLEGENEWSRGRLVYRLEEPSYNRFEGVVGVQGEGGAVGLARLDLDNLLGTGRSTGLSWESRGHGVVHLGARYAEPLVFGTPLRLEGVFDQQVQDTLYVRTRWGARGQYALSGQERLEAGFEEDRVVQEKGEVEEASSQSTVFALERDARDAPLAPRRGTRVRVSAAQSFKTERLRPPGRRSARASSAEIRGEWHRPLGLGSGLALELVGAGRFSSERVLPVYERYPLGGTTSLRGHDEEAFRVDRYALSRFEWRWFFGRGDQRVFAFWDHAWSATRQPVEGVGDRLDVRHDDGIGVGLRIDAAGGRVGVDYGLEPGRPPLEGKIHLQLVSTF